jgi:hypothetical protein
MTRWTLAAVAVLSLLAQAANAADELPFAPAVPQILGQGGAQAASAQGYGSFFSNPAGFSRSAGTLTAVSLSSWLYASPYGLIALPAAVVQAPPDPAGLLGSQVTTGGFGLGAAMGIGYSGNGLGLGTFVVLDSYLHGESLASASGDLTATAAVVLGLSVPLQVLGITVHAGGDVRPMVRIHVPITAGQGPALISSLAWGGDWLSVLASSPALYGMGVAMDLGIIAEIQQLTVGVSVRDLGGTTFNYFQTTVGAVQSSLATGLRLPAAGPAGDTYTVPMSIDAGVALRPDLGKGRAVIDPTVHVDVADIVGLVSGARDPWTYLHAGAEVTMGSLLTVRAGLSQGYITGGIGLRLAFLDLNLAVFTREMGRAQWSDPSTGAVLELALRF